MANPFGDSEVTKTAPVQAGGNPFGDAPSDANPFGDEELKSTLLDNLDVPARVVMPSLGTAYAKIRHAFTAENAQELEQDMILDLAAKRRYEENPQLGPVPEAVTARIVEKQAKLDALKREAAVQASAATLGEQEIQNIMPPSPSLPLEIAADVTANLAQNAPGLAASLITKNPIPAMVTGGVMQQNISQSDALRKGADPNRAEAYGDIAGFTEGFFETLPVSTLLSKYGTGQVMSVLKKYVLEETGTELGTTATQQVAELLTQIEPDKPLKQWLQETKDALVQTALVTPFAAGAQGGIVAGIDRLSGREMDNNPPVNPPPPAAPPPADSDLALTRKAIEQDEDDTEGDTEILDVDRRIAENQALVDEMSALIESGQELPPAAGTPENLNAQVDAQLNEANQNAGWVEGLDSKMSVLKDEGVSRDVAENESNWNSDPNSAIPMADRIITRADSPELIGKRLGDVSPEMLAPGTVIQVGEDSQVRPSHAMEAAIKDLKNLVAEFNPEGIYILLPNNLPKGTQGAHMKHKGVHFIIPRHLDDLSANKQGEPRQIGQHNPTAYQDFVSSLGHEFGHSLVVDHLFAGVDKMQAMNLAAEIQTGTVSETSLALLHPVAQKVVRDWMRVRQLALENKISGRAFAALWFSPTKLANGAKLKNSLWDAVRKHSKNNNWTAMDLVKAYGGEQWLTLDEFMAEQMPKYLHWSGKWNKMESAKALPGGKSVSIQQLKEFFAPLQEKLEAFFGKLKQNKWVKPQDSYVEWLEMLSRSGNVQVEEEGQKEEVFNEAEEKAQINFEAPETADTVRAIAFSLKKAGIIEMDEYSEILKDWKAGYWVDVIDRLEGLLGDKIKFDREQPVEQNVLLHPMRYNMGPVTLNLTLPGLDEILAKGEEIPLAAFNVLLKQVDSPAKRVLVQALKAARNGNVVNREVVKSEILRQMPQITLVPATNYKQSDYFDYDRTGLWSSGYSHLTDPTIWKFDTGVNLVGMTEDYSPHMMGTSLAWSRTWQDGNTFYVTVIQSDFFDKLSVIREKQANFAETIAEWEGKLAHLRAIKHKISLEDYAEREEIILETLTREKSWATTFMTEEQMRPYAQMEKSWTKFVAQTMVQLAAENGFTTIRFPTWPQLAKLQGLDQDAKGRVFNLYKEVNAYLQKRYGAQIVAEGDWYEFSLIGESGKAVTPFPDNAKGTTFNIHPIEANLAAYAAAFGIPELQTASQLNWRAAQLPEVQAIADVYFDAKKTQSPFFKNWFGNSALRDAGGQPALFYTVLAPRLVQGDGIHYRAVSNIFDAAVKSTEQHSDVKTLGVYVKMENPLEVDAKGKKVNEEGLLEQALAQGHDGVKIVNVPSSVDGKMMQVILWKGSWQAKALKNPWGTDRKRNTTFSDSSNIMFDRTDPEQYANATIMERVKGLGKAVQETMRKGLNSFGTWHYRLEQLEQLAHIHPDFDGLVSAAQYEAKYEEAKAQLIERAYHVADKLSWMGDGNLRLLFDLTREEMKSAVHLTELRKEAHGWKHYPTERLAEAIRAKGIDPTSERGQKIGEAYLDAKNALQFQMDRMERVLMAKRLRKYANATPEMQQRAIADVLKVFKDLRAAPFWPHQRFGRFHVIGQRKIETGEMVRYYHEAFDSSEEAQEAFARLKKKYKTNVRLVDSGAKGMDQTILAMLPQNFIEDAVELLNLSQEDADLLKDLAEPMGGQSAMQVWATDDRFAEGGSRDFFRNFSDFSMNVGNLIAKMEYRGYFDVAIKELKDQRKLLAEDISPEGKERYKQLTAAIDQVAKHQQQLFSPSGEFYAIRGFISLLYLSFNIGTALLNLTTLLNTHNWLMANAPKRGEIYFARAFQYGTESLLHDQWGDQTLRDALERAKKQGVINQTYAYMLSGQASTSLMQRLASKSYLGRMTRGVVDTAGMAMFKMTESTLRTVTFLSLVQMLREQNPNMTVEQLTEEAARQTRLIAGNYLAGSRPDLLHGKVRSLFTVFMTYTQLMAFHAYGGMEMGQRRQNALQGRKTPLGSYTLYTLIALGLMAGAEGLPGAESLLDLLDAIGRALGVTDNIRKDIQEYVKEVTDMDPMLIMHGLGHNVGGYDLSGRLGVGRIIPGAEAIYNQSADTAADYYGSLMLSLAGVTGGTLRAFYNTLSELHKGMQAELPWEVTFNNAAKKMPGALGMAGNAYEWASVGPRGPKGGALLLDENGNPRTATASEIIMRGMGFRQTEETLRNEEKFMERDIAAYWQSRRNALLEGLDYATTVTPDDESVKESVMQGVEKYNRQLKELGADYWKAFGITGKDLSARARHARKQARMEQNQRVSGIKARAKSRLADEAFLPPDESSSE